MQVDPPNARRGRVGILPLVVVASLAGALTGVASASFGWLVRHGGDLRADLIGWGHQHGVAGFVLVAAAAVVAVVAAALMVHRIEPHAEGSGIPRVEAVVEGRAAPGRFRILPVKYVGGWLAITAGLALGREGPSVQMGGVIAAHCARLGRLNREDLRMVVAGGAAAGLATAFSAPIAGGVFVLEELFKRFDPRTSLATLCASAAGFLATYLTFGEELVFTPVPLPEISVADSPLVVAVALLCGVLGVAYNRAVMAGLRIVDSTRVPVAARAAGIGVVVAAVAWFRPGWVGGGDGLTEQALRGDGVLHTVLVLLVVRFVLGVLSYCANTPGGLFAPMLVLGTHTGLLVALVAGRFGHVGTATAAGLALVGMAAFFTASVQAPITGLVLATEMTGEVGWLPAMLGAVALAMLVARLLGDVPIYDALAARSARNAARNERARAAGTIEA